MDECCSKVTISSRDGSVYCNPPIVDCDCCAQHHEPHPQPKCPKNCGHQEYILSDGFNVHLEPGKEINQDIILKPNPYRDCGTLSGVIKDKNGSPIGNALVKVFDSQHRPVAHVFTNKEGQFLLCLEPGNYIVKAVR